MLTHISIRCQAWYLLGPVTRFQDEQQLSYEIAGVRFTVEKKKSGGDDDNNIYNSEDFKVSRLGDVSQHSRSYPSLSFDPGRTPHISILEYIWLVSMPCHSHVFTKTKMRASFYVNTMCPPQSLN